jgi:hypothetical protein
MILPNPVKFLTSCEYERVALDQALGDELFLAMHLIMHGCRNYMARLEHYHNEQYDSLGKRDLYFCSQMLRCARLTLFKRLLTSSVLNRQPPNQTCTHAKIKPAPMQDSVTLSRSIARNHLYQAVVNQDTIKEIVDVIST